MKFNKEDLCELVYQGEPEGFEVISREFSWNSRWSLHYEMVFKYEDKYYLTTYSVGATESQDESPYQYEPDEIECQEVVPVEVVTIKYKPVNKESNDNN